MVIDHNIIGSKQTSFHDFQINISGMSLIFSGGSYFQGGQESISVSDSTTINIPTSTDEINYEIWLTKNGLSVLSRKDNENFAYDQLINQIDRLCWFSVPANCSDLITVDVHFVKVVE